MPDLSEMPQVLTWVAGVLLVLAGSAKLRWPSGTVAALTDASLPATAGLVRLLGAAELAVGAAVLLAGGWLPAAATAALYAAFATFAVRQRRTVGASCGCFGAERTPVGPLHVVVNVAAAVAASAAAVTDPGPLVAAGPTPTAVLATGVLVAVAAWLLRLGLTAGAELRAAVALHPREVRS